LVVNLKEMLVFPHAENPTRFIKSNMGSVASRGSGIECLFDPLDSDSDPVTGIEEKVRIKDSGSGINITDHVSESIAL
jgi:hypothetical protein